jgi:membrane-bound ClpP family serine protease
VRPLLALLVSLSLAGLVSAESRVIAVSVDNVVHPITVEMLTHAIDQGAAESAIAVSAGPGHRALGR